MPGPWETRPAEAHSHPLDPVPNRQRLQAVPSKLLRSCYAAQFTWWRCYTQCTQSAQPASVATHREVVVRQIELPQRQLRCIDASTAATWHVCQLGRQRAKAIEARSYHAGGAVVGQAFRPGACEAVDGQGSGALGYAKREGRRAASSAKGGSAQATLRCMHSPQSSWAFTSEAVVGDVEVHKGLVAAEQVGQRARPA